MLKDLGCEYCIVGHSERREYFRETDEMVAKKAGTLIASGVKPIVCIGETLEEREKGVTFEVIETQLRGSLAGMEEADFPGVVIAYEPVWAIGTGKTATTEQAQEVHGHIRGLIENIYNFTLASGVRILYGGSVKPDNVSALMAQKDIDGALVGGASLKAESFLKIAAFDI
jgi:triosephosphate isomerase